MRKVKVVYDSNKEKIRFLIDKKNLADNPRHKIKIDQYFNTRKLEIYRKRQKTGPFVGSLTKQIMQMSSYRIDQFKFDYVYKFLLGQTACVEIMHKGEIKKEYF